MIDFWGVGFDVAERMNLIPCLRQRAYTIQEVRFLNRHGQLAGGFNWDAFRSTLGARFFSILRGDLAGQIFRRIEGRVEVLFANSVRVIREENTGVQVEFETGASNRFDLVIGADGLHSPLRNMVFGAEDKFERYLGYSIASFTVRDYAPRNEGTYVGYNVPRRMVARYALRNDRTGFLFVFEQKTKPSLSLQDRNAQQRLLRDLYERAGWECAAIVEAMDSSNDFYFDAVSQIRLEKWSRGRIALVGDAAYCPSLLAGEGAAFAMAGAYVLATELKKAAGDYQAAFRNYQLRLGRFIERKQRAARGLAKWFAPKTNAGIFLRNQSANLMSIPLIANYAVGRMISDRVCLPAADVAV
jgi:2-polyprenyl-6-methoxyphenol hydroxylase-like FAD-dependent oxidoreductase